MNRNSKKGFTIVELIIVIAVIAVLAAVLIPTFSNLIQKANEAKDTALVSNLNKAVAMDTSKNETVYDVLTTVRENAGYDVGKINAAATNNEILWDSANNCFVYSVNGEIKYIPDTKTKDVEGNYDYWKISSNEKDIADGQYSIYWNGANLASVTVKTGFDAGTAEVAEVNYDRQNESVGRKVTIRTNGGALTVNAPKDTVAHYGKASGVQIMAVYGNSYHEYGEVVGDIVITKGRIELAATAQVGTVLVASESIGAVKVDVVSGAQVGTVAPTTPEAKKDVEASTSIPTESKKTDVVNVNSDFAGGLGTERSPYLIATAEQFAKISSYKGGKYFKQTANITINAAVATFEGYYDGGNYQLVYKSNTGTSRYIFGRLTAYTEIKNWNILMGKVGVTLVLTADWGTSNGALFENIVFDTTESLVTVNENNFGLVLIEAIYTGKPENLDEPDEPSYIFRNIVNNVNLQNEGTCTGFIVGSGPCFNTKTVLKYENCVNNGNILGGQFVGYLYGNSAYIESVESSGSEIFVNNCKNNGVLSTTSENGMVAFAPKLVDLNEKYQNSVGGSFLSTNYFTGKTFTINQEGTSFTINTNDTAVVYKLAFNVASIYYTKSGKAWTENEVALITPETETWSQAWDVSNGKKYLIDLNVDTAATGALTNSFKAYDKKTAQAKGITATSYTDGYAIVVKDGVTYLIFDVRENTYINCNVSLMVYAYDANNNILGIKKVK